MSPQMFDYVAECVYVLGVWTGASFWESQGKQPRQRAILRPPLPALLPTQPLC